VWSNLGAIPASDEYEVTIMGPGHGESVIVHLGNGDWLIIDSCIDSLDGNRLAAPLKYLQAIGVKVEDAVKYIIISHWDDDHFKGIADVLEACPNAVFVASDVFSESKFSCFVEAVAVGARYAEGGNVDNMSRVLRLLQDRGKAITRAVPARQLCTTPLIRSWSPSDLDSQYFLENIVQMHPKAGEEYRKAIWGSPNLTSIVISIEWADSSVLLCADMEHTNHAQRGWNAVVSEIEKIGMSKADMVKVPHHGSKTGHHEPMWNQLLTDKPISLIAPFGKGALKTRPPTSSDISRISRKSSQVYLSARHKTLNRPRMDVEVQRSIREGLISLTSQKTEMGIVRHRRLPQQNWRYELFGAAYKVK
jgi:beta-lactamase superfamily II metal-dependent hydrolase